MSLCDGNHQELWPRVTQLKLAVCCFGKLLLHATRLLRGKLLSRRGTLLHGADEKAPKIKK